MNEEWRPAASRYAVDRNGTLGRVDRRYEGSVYLRPPGGGREWAVPPGELREPTPEELVQARLFATPVTAVEQ
ncbi:hypothetical protein ACFUJR_02625 [Streptomyces sp. NPDC057271]|uniref:hypothetical protein n=1 Tax=unclassified Streptomyces TaxID=2593676 RepID=UPI003626C687